MSNKVYIVERGEQYEGGNVMGVFSSIAKARIYVKEYLLTLDGYGAYKYKMIEQLMSFSDEDILKESITHGGYYIEVNEYEVK